MMAHDRQLAENNNEQSGASKQSKGHSAIVADWLTLYAQTYREEITEEMALLYVQSLKDIKPETLHKAFMRAAKSCKFRPTPAEIREQAELIAEECFHGTAVRYPEISQEEREAALEYSQKLKEILEPKEKPEREIWIPPAAPDQEYDLSGYENWLQEKIKQDEKDRQSGLSPVARSKEELEAMFMSIPLEVRRRMAKEKEWRGRQ